jgi:hypothetical protein
MKAIVQERFGSPDVLQQRPSSAGPTPGRHRRRPAPRGGRTGARQGRHHRDLNCAHPHPRALRQPATLRGRSHPRQRPPHRDRRSRRPAVPNSNADVQHQRLSGEPFGRAVQKPGGPSKEVVVMQIRQYLHRGSGHPAMTLTGAGISGGTAWRTRTGGRSACGIGAHTELTASV